jgi:hypothetical protein
MAKSRRKKHRHRRKQKTIMMVGCSRKMKRSRKMKYKGGSGCGPNGCPIPPMSYSQINKYGGNSSFVGKPWGTSVNEWPGVNDSRNYLSQYDLSKDPQRGGGFLPQDLVNLGRDFSFNMKSTYNALNGNNAPVNPLPYKDQLTSSNKLYI